jgi:DNA-directed RNA polymerase specialized sigma24 family protein
MLAHDDADPTGLAGPLTSLAVDELSARCAEELARFARRAGGDGRYGHQLFQRALVGRDPDAWAALDRVYRPCLARWARAHPLYAQADEEAEAFANQALAQLWRRVDADRFAAFPSLANLLAYLQRCVHHLVVDAARARARERARAAALGGTLATRPSPTLEGPALERMAAGELWALVRAHCHGEREARLAWGALVVGLPPRELLALDAANFESVAAINAGLANLRRRLRRSPALRQRRHALADG